MAERTPIVPTVRPNSASFEVSPYTHIEVWKTIDGADKVTWPSRNAYSPARAREFALAILDACDWVDEQKQEAVDAAL